MPEAVAAGTTRDGVQLHFTTLDAGSSCELLTRAMLDADL